MALPWATTLFPKTEVGDAKDNCMPQTCGDWASGKNINKRMLITQLMFDTKEMIL